jgi:hypothetical protein
MTCLSNALILSVALLPAAGLAQAGTAAANRAGLVAASQKGPEFRNDRQAYRVMVGMQAVLREDATAVARAANLGLPAADVVEQKGPYAIVTRTPVGDTAAARLEKASAVAEVAGEPTFPVVVNVRTGQLGVVSGTVLVKMADVEEAAALAQANGLAVEYVAGPIGYAFLRVPAGKDVFATLVALRRDARVSSAYAEIRERFTAAR